ncbi:MAG: Death on curing protein, Doc toxin [uncultured Sulfurovum sp.]|uniref:Death on curing protein, Doc toxin n=1 Tax=uncultured Sulfurovum sp. TaxID=269237 RepID=A0A6S6U4U3_9BACT|nr:MAG: Death on curing protein, Doc toxin [uncultured Sulfurovum sp.]
MKKFTVEWTKNAQFDLEEIITYIKMDSVSIAKKIFFEIKKECDELYYMPERKRIVPELQQIGILNYREIIYKRWRIIFKIEQERVYVLVVADSSRNLEDILLQRLIK